MRTVKIQFVNGPRDGETFVEKISTSPLIQRTVFATWPRGCYVLKAGQTKALYYDTCPPDYDERKHERFE